MTSKEKAKRTVSEKTKKNLPSFQRSNYTETQAEFDTHVHRLEKTGSAFGAAAMKKKHAVKKALHKKQNKETSAGSFLNKRKGLK